MWRNKAYFEGDKDSEDAIENLEFPANIYPPGTKIIIKEPVCPKCHLIREFCNDDCLFDWEEWTLDQYS